MNFSPMKAVVARLADFLCAMDPKVTAAALEEAIARDHMNNIVESFAKGEQASPACIYVFLLTPGATDERPSNRVVVSRTSMKPNNTRRGLYAIRLGKRGKRATPVKEADLINDVLVGCLHGDCTAELGRVMNDVVDPQLDTMLGHTTKDDKTNEAQLSAAARKPQPTVSEDYRASLQRLITRVAELTGGQPESVLPLHQLTPLLKETSSTAAGMHKAAQDQRLVHELETLLEKWRRLIITATTHRQLDPEAVSEEDGPLTHVEYWRKYVLRCEKILEDVGSTVVRQAVRIISIARPEVHVQWQAAVSRSADAATEARSICKYMSSVERYFTPLYSGQPETVFDVIPQLIDNMFLLHTTVPYYGTPDSIAVILASVSGAMICCCKQAIRSQGKVWEQTDKLSSLNTLLARFEEAVQLGRNFQQEYYKKTLDLNELHIFGKLELFSKRVIKLADLVGTVKQFRLLSDFNLEGFEPLLNKFFGVFDDLKRSGDPLDYSKPTFDKEYIEFSQKVQELECSMQVYINSAFESVTSSMAALTLLKKFDKLLSRPALRADLISKYLLVFQNYGTDLEAMIRLYDENKQDPPLMRDSPPVAGRVLWARQLWQRIEEPMTAFQKSGHVVFTQRDTKKVVKMFNKVAGVLTEYETWWMANWERSLETTRTGLTATVVIKHKNRYLVNFDRAVHQMMREARWMKRFGIQPPPLAEELLRQEARLSALVGSLSTQLKRYDDMLLRINPVVKTALTPHLDAVESAIRPGISYVTWMSMNVEGYINGIDKNISHISDIVDQTATIANHRIQRHMKEITRTVSVNVSEVDPCGTAAFYTHQQHAATAVAKDFEIRNAEVEAAVVELCDVIAGRKGAPLTEDLERVCIHFNRMLFKSVLSSTTRSLQLLKRKLGNRTASGFIDVAFPFFEVWLVTDSNDLAIQPSMTELQECVNGVATMVIEAGSSIGKWGVLSSSDAFVDEVSRSKDIVKVVLLLTGSISGLRKQVSTFLHSFDPFTSLWRGNKTEVVRAFADRRPTLEEMEEKLREFDGLQRDVNLLKPVCVIGPLAVNTTQLKSTLTREIALWKAKFGECLHQRAEELLERISDSIDVLSKLVALPVTEDLSDLQRHISTLQEVRQKDSVMEMQMGPLDESYRIIQHHHIDVPREELDRVGELRQRWRKLRLQASDLSSEIRRLQHYYKRDLLNNVLRFKVEVVCFYNDYEANGPGVAGLKPTEAIERLKRFQRICEDKGRRWTTYRLGEEIFGCVLTQYPELAKISREIAHFDRLYSLYVSVTSRINGYKEILWVRLSFKSIVEEVVRMQEQLRRLPGNLKHWLAYKEMKEMIDGFVELQPVLEQLSQPAVRERHWRAVMELCGKTWKLDPELFKLRDIIDANLLPYKEEVVDLAMASEREAEVENKIRGVVKDWKDKELSFAEFKHRGLIVLKGDDTAQLKEQLEESLVLLGSLLASRYVGPFRSEVNNWTVKLSSVSEAINLWGEVQATWMYLEAVFAGGDIMKQLPHEAKRFGVIDKQWVKIFVKANEVRNVIDFCYGNELLSGLPYLKEQLEICQRQLAAYLEQKRNAFARFYFASDSILLEILSQSSDPLSIQPHLSCIFDGLTHVTFSVEAKKTARIVAMHDPEGEVVKLEEPVVCLGHVEEWLWVLCTEMQRTIKAILRDAVRCVSSFRGNPQALHRLIFDYPSQIVVTALQLWWTADVSNALSQSKQAERKECTREIAFIKDFLTDLTRTDLKPMDRIHVETLITMQVHNQDVWEQGVRRAKDPSSFDWVKQLRFFWTSEKDTCMLRIADAELLYCYEYLGVKERLVITTLTDRCYITLSQALAMHMGGAPMGPAGTGKTETVKDLGRAAGKYVVVFNCSDQWDFRSLGKIFKGLTQSGAWGSFDEFNRIALPVLSVVAQQVHTIFTALKQRKHEFVFTDGSHLKLIPSTGVFITMNPGYKGRQELPENLKALFRNISMMVPDRTSIMKVKLAAAGYKQDAMLAKKFNLAYQMCEQQLSKQQHYDFGLRNILSVLRSAGAVLRASTDMDEEFIFMRTVRDMNLSKLVHSDIEVFTSLLHDIFPFRSSDRSLFPQLQDSLVTNATQLNITPTDAWVKKCIQIYEAKLVRHGIMVIGPAGGGKTVCYNCLLKSLTATERKHKEVRMNPKAITAQQMFGRMDLATGDWLDGIFSCIWRKANKERAYSIWIVCDGPVDTLWIESLNTVLDDNKLLTLPNGDRILMSPTVKMCFEAEHLNNASPATVSRVGIVNLSLEDVGWLPVLQSILQPPNPSEVCLFNTSCATLLLSLSEQHLSSLYGYVTRELRMQLQVGLQHIVATLTSLAAPLCDEVGKVVGPKDQEAITMIFWFCVTWSIGGLLDAPERLKFSEHIVGNVPMFPAEGSVFEYFVNVSKHKWDHWDEKLSQPTLDRKNLNFSKLFVPTLDTVRLHFIAQSSFTAGRPVLLVGGPGTAKTVIVEQFAQQIATDRQAWIKSNLSCATTPHMFQNFVEGIVEKRLGSTYGPMRNKKMLLFLDDVNLPEVNEWGDQVTCEIIRQLMEYQGFYSLDRIGEWKKIIDVSYAAAMSNPAGGNNDIPSRLKRHFNALFIPLPPDKAVTQIYQAVLTAAFTGSQLLKEVPNIVELTIKLWRKCQATLLPTPSRFHYSFNLRDLSRITHGICMAPLQQLTETASLITLWRHECTRVFRDKLNDASDIDWFNSATTQLISAKWGGHSANLATPHFCNFLRPSDIDPETGEEVVVRVYEAATGVEQIRKRIESFVANHNTARKGVKLDLVLFDTAVDMVARLVRILSMPRGSAMLIGVGGSGKQSLSKLASVVVGQQFFQPTVHSSYTLTNLFEDLRIQYLAAGTDTPTTFCFTDAEVRNESFLEYINAALASGDVPGLFNAEDKDMARNAVRGVAKRENRREFVDSEEWLWNYFIHRVRDNCHFILCFSPQGEKFRRRARQFPALMSCCTVNWCFPWPKEALLDVVAATFSRLEFKKASTAEQLAQYASGVHMLMPDFCKDYFTRFRRSVFVTPKSFLTFISTFERIYTDKMRHFQTQYDAVAGGLVKLAQAGEDVQTMRVELNQKEVLLKEARLESEKLLAEISAATEVAETQKEEVSRVKDQLASEAATISAARSEAEQDLLAAQPALEAAKRALDNITTSDMKTLKSMAKPPEMVRRIFDGVCILFQAPVDDCKAETGKSGKLILADSWISSGRPLVCRSDFVENLFQFNVKKKEQINDETCELLMPYLDQDDFTFERARTACGNVAGLCTWVRAMVTYRNISKYVAPKIEKLRVAEYKLRFANAKLQDKQRELDKVQENLDQWTAKLRDAQKRKQELEDDATRTRNRMDSAAELIFALGDEKERWKELSHEFSQTIARVPGDAIVVAAFATYGGPFNADFRRLLLTQMLLPESMRRNVSSTTGITMIKYLADDQTVTDWQICGLPLDDHSVENAIIATLGLKVPLLVDPQGQGLQWMRNYLEPKGVATSELSNKGFYEVVKQQLMDGLPLLVENVQQVDTALDSLLERRVVRVGTKDQLLLQGEPHDFHPAFRMFLCTSDANPSYDPEVFAKVSVIDFSITLTGLQQQLLARVIQREKNELEEMLSSLVAEINDNERRLRGIEDTLLEKLSSSQGNLIDDDTLVATLAESKKAATEVKQNISVASDTRKKISSARQEYAPVAHRGALLYFVCAELSRVNPMYQTSLEQFVKLFYMGLEDAAASPQIQQRLRNIVECVTSAVYHHVLRGLFDAHKLLFSLMIATKVELHADNIEGDEFRCFIRGGAAYDFRELNLRKPKPFPWISPAAWCHIVALMDVPKFRNLSDLMTRSEHGWKIFFDNPMAPGVRIPDYPNATPFEHLLVVRCLREDLTLGAAQQYVQATLGSKYMQCPPINLERVSTEADARTPIIFLLSPGNDPTPLVEHLARKHRKPIATISMGEGQEEAAMNLLTHATTEGTWVVFQNCHLGLPFLRHLELWTKEPLPASGEDGAETRVWITAEPTPQFPVAVLQRSLKLTNEPPQGLLAGMTRAYTIINQDTFESFRSSEWRSMLFSLSFFNCCIHERRKYRSIGWALPYQFSEGDWTASLLFLMNHFAAIGDDTKKRVGVSWDAVRFMIGDIQYGGRVTDSRDRVLLQSLTESVFTPRMIDNDYTLCKELGLYPMPPADDYLTHKNYIPATFPEQAPPQVIGLGQNAEISYRLNAVKDVLDMLREIQPKQSSSGGSGQTREDYVMDLVDEFKKKLPPSFTAVYLGDAATRLGRTKPLTIFFGLEAVRYSALINKVLKTIADLGLAIAGSIVMTPLLENVVDALFNGITPACWDELQPAFGGWQADLIRRYEQLRDYLEPDSVPIKYTLSLFFNPRGFLNSVRQEISQKHTGNGEVNWVLDRVELRTEITRLDPNEVQHGPEEGVYVYGLALQGAGWDRQKQRLRDSLPGVLYQPLPIVHVFASISATAPAPGGEGGPTAPRGYRAYREVNTDTVKRVRIPVYRHPARSDACLVFEMDVPYDDKDATFWILRGVAALCAIN